MERQFERNSFAKRLKSMLKVDFRRAFTMPLLYIMVGACFVLPILILVMTSMMGATTVDPVTQEEVAAETFTNVWQAMGAASGSGSTGGFGSITETCNINMLYFFIAVWVGLFVAEDFRSGYAKNLFTVREKKTDYVISKTLVGFVGGACMLLAFFIGAMLGGGIAKLSFDLAEVGASVGGIIACMFAKIFLVLVFVAIDLAVAVAAKQRAWLSVLGSLCAGMLLFTMIPMISPLNSTFLHVILSLAGGGLFSLGLGAVSNLILKKTSLV
ncbi:MAG: hypothetical protein IJ308_02230 [Clostridia bacterium]|nr:hypothetical protein [Clostridia bacterium]